MDEVTDGQFSIVNDKTAVVLAVWFLVAIAWAYLVKWSVMTNMCWYPPDDVSTDTDEFQWLTSNDVDKRCCGSRSLSPKTAWALLTPVLYVTNHTRPPEALSTRMTNVAVQMMTVTPAVSERHHLPVSLCNGLHVECGNCRSSCTSQSWMVYMEIPVVWVVCCLVRETSKVQSLCLHSVLFSNL